MDAQSIRITLKAFDHRILDTASSEILNTAKRTGASVCGPVPLPNRITKVFCYSFPAREQKLARAVRNADSQERLLDVIDPTPQTIDALMKLDLPAGVDVEIKIGQMQAA